MSNPEAVLRLAKEKSDSEAVLKFAKEHQIEMIDLKFVDLPGSWQHFSMPVAMLTKQLFEDGITFDGSSIRGFQPIHKSDMLMIPDPSTAFIDPFMSNPTLTLICNIAHPMTKEPFEHDPRYVARKAEQFLRDTLITTADTAYFGPEIEFYIFDAVHFASSDNLQYSEIDSSEADWNSKGSTEKHNLGHPIHQRRGYLSVPPDDSNQDLRTDMLLHLRKLGVPAEGHHHEVGAPGQAEIRFHYSTLVETADWVLLYKYVMKNVAQRHKKTVTFMPKPILGDNGSGMHTHQSLWEKKKPLFFAQEDKYAGISELALYYIGGILEHAPAILAIAAPSTNSYKRLVPGFEAPVNLVFSKGNRSAAVRIPLTTDPTAKRIEFRPPDPTANPYLLFSALLMAGLDGIKRQIDPKIKGFGPQDLNLYKLPESQQQRLSPIPSSLDESLKALQNDADFLLEGDVFTSELIKEYIDLKHKQVDLVRQCPSPIEFSLYYGA